MPCGGAVTTGTAQTRHLSGRRAAVTKGGRPRPEPHERPELGYRPIRLRGFLRRPRLGAGEPAPQDLVLGLQSLDRGFENAHER